MKSTETMWTITLRNFFEQIHKSHDLYTDTVQPLAIRNLYRHIHINQIALMQENVNRLGPLIELKVD